MSSQINHRASARVLAGSASYDELGDGEQANVREVWSRRMTELRNSLDYAARFSAAGESYSETDENGDLMMRPAP